LNAADIADQLGIPFRVVRDMIDSLLNARIITETLNQDLREVVYQPAIDPSKITVSFVLDTIDNQGKDVSHDQESTEYKQVVLVVESFYEDIRKSPKNILIKDL